MWLPLYLEHRYSELRVPLGGVYLWWERSAPPCLFWWLWVGSQSYQILGWLLQLVSSDHLLGKLFSSLTLWGSVCPLPWVGFSVSNKMFGPVCVASVLVYAFLLVNWVHCYEEILRKSNCCFLLFLLLDFKFCSCGYVLLGLLKDYFLAFSRA